MGDTTFESKIKKVYANASDIYSLLSDMNNIQKFQQLQQKMNENSANLTDEQKKQFEKMNEMKSKVKNFEYDADSVHFEVSPMGRMGLKVLDREPEKVIKFGADGSPIDFNFWIQVKQIAENESALKLTLKADIPFMLKMMLNSKLEKGIEQLADMLVQIPYKNINML